MTIMFWAGYTLNLNLIVIYYKVTVTLIKSLINSVSYENYEIEYSKEDDFIISVYYIDTHQRIQCV
jgi:hypothetical protein